MKIEKEYLLTHELAICENCEWAMERQDTRFLTCLLSKQEKGLVEQCKNFKKKTGNHITD